PIPSASGLAQACLASGGAAVGADAAAAAGLASVLAGGVCDHAAPPAQSEIAPAKINPAATRMLAFLFSDRFAPRVLRDLASDFPILIHHSRVAALRQIGFCRV